MAVSGAGAPGVPGFSSQGNHGRPQIMEMHSSEPTLLTSPDPDTVVSCYPQALVLEIRPIQISVCYLPSQPNTTIRPHLPSELYPNAGNHCPQKPWGTIIPPASAQLQYHTQTSKYPTVPRPSWGNRDPNFFCFASLGSGVLAGIPLGAPHVAPSPPQSARWWCGVPSAAENRVYCAVPRVLPTVGERDGEL